VAGALRSSPPARWRRAYRTWQFLRSRPGARLLRTFERAHPDAFFVQVGSNDGEQFDPLRRAILRTRWRGIMVEPVPEVFRRLHANYGHLSDRIALENVAVADRDGSLPFYHLATVEDHRREGLPQWYDGIGSFDRDHVLKHVDHIPDVERRLVCTEVPAVTFDSLCERNHVDALDLLQIDVEGYDDQLIRSIDLARWRPRLIIYEHYHLAEPAQRACRGLLASQGYATIEDGMDTWCMDVRRTGRRDKLSALWHSLSEDAADHTGAA
jgi:FkbM family methyltransferase